ncbi:MAG: S41 family peptidase [Bacteroidia bacterium]
MQRKSDYLLPFLFAVFLAIGMILGANFNPSNEGFGADEYSKKLNQVLGYIESSYVDDPNKEELIEGAITEMLSELDPYSSYISAKDLSHATEQLEGNFDGIGVEFNVRNDTVTILHVIPGGPSEKVGLLPGDQIINVEGETIAGIGINNSEIIRELKGPKDTKVAIEIKRKTESELLDFEITRDKIKIESVVASYMANSHTGYIKVTRFAGNTSNDFKNSIEDLKAEGAKSLVVDLRGNPGGYLGAATSMVDQFLNSGDLITYTQGRSRNREDYEATGDGIFRQGNLVVLINENSASASEIFSGAIQDQDRGLIVGQRSHGKGLVQEPIVLRDGSQIRLTVARYYTPSGRCIQRPYDMSIENGANDSTAETFTTKKGRTVLEGGGVVPDIIVEEDSLYKNGFYQGVLRKGLIYDLALGYFNTHLKQLESSYTNFESYDQGFEVPAMVIDSSKSVLRKSEFNFTEDEADDVRLEIESQFKALIARYIWGDNAFYTIMNRNDQIMKKALDAIENEKLAAFGISSNADL